MWFNDKFVIWGKKWPIKQRKNDFDAKVKDEEAYDREYVRNSSYILWSL